MKISRYARSTAYLIGGTLVACIINMANIDAQKALLGTAVMMLSTIGLILCQIVAAIEESSNVDADAVQES